MDFDLLSNKEKIKFIKSFVKYQYEYEEEKSIEKEKKANENATQKLLTELSCQDKRTEIFLELLENVGDFKLEQNEDEVILLKHHYASEYQLFLIDMDNINVILNKYKNECKMKVI